MPKDNSSPQAKQALAGFCPTGSTRPTVVIFAHGQPGYQQTTVTLEELRQFAQKEEEYVQRLAQQVERAAALSRQA